MNNKEKIAVLEELLDCEEGTLKMDTCLDEVEEWDSMTKLSLMAYVKKEFGHTLNAEDIISFKTIEDICRVLA